MSTASAVETPSRFGRIVDRVLLGVLIYNTCAGLIDSGIGYFGTTVLSFPPTQLAGWWLPAVGGAAIFFWTKSRTTFHALASLFYAAQVFAFYGEVQVDWWIGLNYGIELGDIEVDPWVLNLNLAAAVFGAVHFWRLTTRWSERGRDKVPTSITQQRVAQRGR